MNVVLISTCDMKGGRAQLLQRMIDSVARAAPAIDGQVILFLLLQRCPPEDLQNFNAPAFARMQASDGLLSLSGARNRLLNTALREHLDWDNTIVAFPDDDGFYPPTTLETLADAFRRDPLLDFWFCRYAAAPVGAGTPGLPALRPPALPEVVRRASSNTIFLRGGLAFRIGDFDEELGVGTRNGSGEDTDFAIRAFLAARRTLYLDAAAVGHRDPNIALRPRYYRGNLVVLSRHAKAGRALALEFLRKLLIGAYIVAKGELSWRDYGTAIASAFKEFGRGQKTLPLPGTP